MFSASIAAWTLCLLPLVAQAVPVSHAERMAAVLAWLEEDIDLAEKSGLPGIAASRRADQAGLRSAPPVATTVRSHPDLLPPIARAEGNPVMKDFFRNLHKTVLTPDKRLPKGPEGGKGLTDEGWAFVVRANELLKLTQAFCHPQSELAGRPDLVAPLLRRRRVLPTRRTAPRPVAIPGRHRRPPRPFASPRRARRRSRPHRRHRRFVERLSDLCRRRARPAPAFRHPGVWLRPLRGHRFCRCHRQTPRRRVGLVVCQWDAANYLSSVTAPMLWVNGTNDHFFWLPAWQQSYRQISPARRTLALRAARPHGHPPAGDPPEVLAFADSVVRGAAPFAIVEPMQRDGDAATAGYRSSRPILRAELNYCVESEGPWEPRKWLSIPATLTPSAVTVRRHRPAPRRRVGLFPQPHR